MSQAQTRWQYLERKPGSNYKQLFLKGRRIMARTLYGAYMSEEDPQTIEQIAADWDLPVEAVREAIQYCQSDPPEIREDFEREEALMKAMGMNDPGYKYNARPKPLSPEEIAAVYREVEDRRGK